MATITDSAIASDPAKRVELPLLERILRLLVPFRRPTRPRSVASVEAAEPVELTFLERIQKFLWLSSGLFSAASFTIPGIGFLVYGTIQGMDTNFLAAVVSACLFGITSVLHFGPEEA